MARHLRRSRPRAERPRSLHQPRLRPRHRGRVLPHPAQAPPAGPRAAEPGGSRMTSFPPMTCQKPARWGIPRYGSVPRSRSERLLGLLFMTDACHRRRKELPFPQSRPTTVPRPAPPAWVHPNSSREGSALGAGSHAFEQAGSHTSENRQETHLRTELVLAALDMAVAQRRPRDVIHHSDQGCQYTSVAFGGRCRAAGIRPSMGSVGDAYDNALCESFFATLECELLDRQRFAIQAEARGAIFDF